MKGAIMLSGGGSGKLFAAIGVTYPAGSTLTCTNGTKTLTAKNTSGQWVFAIPEAGTWTVTATDGTNTKSQSVSITKEGQFESVGLSYRLYLFESGKGHQNGFTTKTTFGTTTVDANKGYIKLDDSGTSAWNRGYFTPEIDVSKYSTLTVDFETLVPEYGTTPSRFGLITGSNNLPTSGDGKFTAFLDMRGDARKDVLILDISEISGAQYIAWVLSPTTQIYNLYLS